MVEGESIEFGSGAVSRQNTNKKGMTWWVQVVSGRGERKIEGREGCSAGLLAAPKWASLLSMWCCCSSAMYSPNEQYFLDKITFTQKMVFLK